MRWKLLRRRLSISAPRMSVRSHMPWPLRWAAVALMFGFSAALALWAFEFGRNLAGLDHSDQVMRVELKQLRLEAEQLRGERDKAQSIANTADSLLKAERAAQERLVAQLKTLEAENLALKGDLGFFERLLPAAGGNGPAVRALHAEVAGAGKLHYQLLVMQQGGRDSTEFKGRCELLLSGILDNRPWTLPVGDTGTQHTLQFRQYQRVEGVVQYPAQAIVKQVQVRVVDANGQVRTTQLARL